MQDHPEDRYVAPGMRYLKLLHATVLAMPGAGSAEFGRSLAADARQVTDDELKVLLDGDWRSQLTAAWLAGLSCRTAHRDRIAELLLASRVVYAGQGFCFALARFGTHQDALVLAGYLDRYLPQVGLNYDQSWALGALLHLDERLGTHEGDRFLGGLWQRWAQPQTSLEQDPAYHRELASGLCSFADECMRTE